MADLVAGGASACTTFQDLRKAGFKEDTIAKIIDVFSDDYPCAFDMETAYIESIPVEQYGFSMENISKLGFTDTKTKIILELLEEQDADEDMPCHSVPELAVESILFLRYSPGTDFVETVFSAQEKKVALPPPVRPVCPK